MKPRILLAKSVGTAEAVPFQSNHAIFLLIRLPYQAEADSNSA
jgi:hypothetical protein